MTSYPTLPNPPNQNLGYNYPPPQNNNQIPYGYPQLPHPNHQPYPIQNPPIYSNPNSQPYIQPNQYAYQSLPNQQPPVTAKDLELKLQSGWYFAYWIYLFFVIFFSCFAIGYLGIFSLFGFYFFNPDFNNVGGTVCGLGLLIWLVRLCALELRVISVKDSVKAKKALVEIETFSIIYLITILFFLGYNIGQHTYFSQNTIRALLTLFILCYTVPVGFTLKGAREVIKLLKKRDEALLQNPNSFSNIA